MQRETILVVDDNAQVAEALVALVRTLGYEATAAYGGREALEYVRALPTGLVLLDLQMPGISGFDVLRALRADPRLALLPVVLCTAAPTELVREEAIRLGAQAFMAKEDAFDELERVLTRLFRGPVAKVASA